MSRRGPRPERSEGSTPRPERSEGSTLVELLVALAVLGIFAGAVTATLVGTSRAALRETRSLLGGRALGSLQGFLQQELRDAGLGDVAILSTTRLALSRPIGEALPCAVSDTAVLIADTAWTGTRSPQAVRDSAWLLVDPVAGSWQAAAITAVVSDRCPVSNAAALRLAVAGGTGTVMLRVMEPVELRAYRSGVADWFGLASATAALQPFSGPLAPATSQWTLFPGRLETALQPADGAPAVVTIPLAPGP
ncbi:MAG: PulJ/GspJ family protein [Gemmatimonadales bacterium]